jgi:hypothetical protein
MKRPKRTLWERRKQYELHAARLAYQAGYFRFAFRFAFRAFFFFAALRAGFFAAILRTVDLFFLLFAVIGMKQLLLRFRWRNTHPRKTVRI